MSSQDWGPRPQLGSSIVSPNVAHCVRNTCLGHRSEHTVRLMYKSNQTTCFVARFHWRSRMYFILHIHNADFSSIAGREKYQDPQQPRLLVRHVMHAYNQLIVLRCGDGVAASWSASSKIQCMLSGCTHKAIAVPLAYYYACSPAWWVPLRVNRVKHVLFT